jgi:hypothetical protein
MLGVNIPSVNATRNILFLKFSTCGLRVRGEGKKLSNEADLAADRMKNSDWHPRHKWRESDNILFDAVEFLECIIPGAEIYQP